MWVFNVFLYLCFLFNPPAYEALVHAGATCQVYVSDHGEGPGTPPPPCFYQQ
jgi:hypothetical protein